ncbi:type II secretion system protein [Vibrio fluvialis]|uniref:type II secretion system protein n=1 Tax=Vibrio fluvialis TaxID=676 RepID=UPI00192BD160|nr:type II secretion system protein [Vibrio fluvialis]MBL4262811.1 type II secretion system protein [Vibrio fluvialis]
MKVSKNCVTRRNKQGGFGVVDQFIAIVMAFGVLVYIFGIKPEVDFNTALSLLQTEVNSVADAMYKQKKTKATYKDSTMENMCSDKYLTGWLCEGTPGKNVNAFGGDIEGTADTTNPALRSIKVTIPSDADRINEIADTLASQSRSRCTSATDCDTITVSGTTITVIK